MSFHLGSQVPATQVLGPSQSRELGNSIWIYLVLAQGSIRRLIPAVPLELHW